MSQDAIQTAQEPLRADLGLSPAGLAEMQAVRLACGPKRRRDLDAEFRTWLDTQDGQTVYVEFVRRALALREAGWKHYSADALVHAVRFDRSVKVGPDADGWKISDHHTARLARLAMANVPELAGLFETRRLR